ncbi:hypothetical protein MW887_010678 [Aspergillus wentii]|nr:hypothetical protein MW887_010678 [Aspergillus wentii]
MDTPLLAMAKNPTLIDSDSSVKGWPLLLDGVDTDDLPVSELHSRRLSEQTFLTHTNRDLYILRRAITAFSSLQQVKLLRLQDAADEQLLDYLRDRSLEQTTSLNWAPACTRAVTSLGAALLESDCSSIRFVGPQISPEATVMLLQVPSVTLSAVGARLTSLDVNFHSVIDITNSMETLSKVFHGFFLAARNLTTIHLGFPAGAPLGLKLEQIFHRVQWKRLRTLGIQGWRLSSDELIEFARRHRRQIRDLRLLSIYLRDGGRWRDVLSVLHDEMEHLERLDLRDIDYAAHFDADTMIHGNGGEVFENPTLSLGADPTPDPSSPLTQTIFTDGAHLSILPRKDYTPGPLSDAMLERLRGLTANDLGDDGISVKREQRSLWEAWVLSSLRNIIRRPS